MKRLIVLLLIATAAATASARTLALKLRPTQNESVLIGHVQYTPLTLEITVPDVTAASATFVVRNAAGSVVISTNAVVVGDVYTVTTVAGNWTADTTGTLAPGDDPAQLWADLYIAGYGNPLPQMDVRVRYAAATGDEGYVDPADGVWVVDGTSYTNISRVVISGGTVSNGSLTIPVGGDITGVSITAGAGITGTVVTTSGAHVQTLALNAASVASLALADSALTNLTEGSGVTITGTGRTRTIAATGTTDHSALSNLDWIATGHTGTPARLAGFFEGGSAGYAGFGEGMYLDGSDNIAVSNAVLAGAAAGLAYTGTVDSVTVNGTNYTPTAGVVTLPDYPTDTGISASTATGIAEAVVVVYTQTIDTAVQPTDPTYTQTVALAAGAVQQVRTEPTWTIYTLPGPPRTYYLQDEFGEAVSNSTSLSALANYALGTAQGFRNRLHFAGGSRYATNDATRTRFQVDAPIYVNNACIITGDGNPMTFIEPVSNATYEAMFIVGTNDIASLTTFRGIRFSGDSQTSTNLISAIKFVQAFEPNLRDCEFYLWSGPSVVYAPTNLVSFYSSVAWAQIDTCWFVTKGGTDAIKVMPTGSAKVSELHVFDCLFSLTTLAGSTTTGLRLESGSIDNVQVNNCRFSTGFTTNTTNVYAISAGTGTAIRVANNSFYGWDKGNAILFNPSSSNDFNALVIGNHAAASVNTSADEFAALGSNAYGISVGGNAVEGFSGGFASYGDASQLQYLYVPAARTLTWLGAAQDLSADRTLATPTLAQVAAEGSTYTGGVTVATSGGGLGVGAAATGAKMHVTVGATETNLPALLIDSPATWPADATVLQYKRGTTSLFKLDEDGDVEIAGNFLAVNFTASANLAGMNVILSAADPDVRWGDNTTSDDDWRMEANADELAVIQFVGDATLTERARFGASGGLFLSAYSTNMIAAKDGKAGIFAAQDGGDTNNVELFALDDQANYNPLTPTIQGVKVAKVFSLNRHLPTARYVSRANEEKFMRDVCKKLNLNPDDYITDTANPFYTPWETDEAATKTKTDAAIAAWQSDTNAVEVKGEKPAPYMVKPKPTWLADALNAEAVKPK